MSDLSMRRPNLVAGRSPDLILGQVNLWHDPTAFVMQPLGENSNLGRNTLVGPAFWQLITENLRTGPCARLPTDRYRQEEEHNIGKRAGGRESRPGQD
jgi:hypothetical protein